MNARGLSSWLFLSLLATPYLCGCIPPITVKDKPVAESLGGTRTAPPIVPVAGHTTRQEVEQSFHAYQVDLGTPIFYWAHFYKSDRAFWDTHGRIWQSLNMVATFDSNQVVKSVRVFSGTQLPDEVARMFQQGQLPALDCTVPIKVEAERYPMDADERSLRADQLPVTILVAQSKLTITATLPGRWIPHRSARSLTIDVPREQVKSLWIDSSTHYSIGDKSEEVHFCSSQKLSSAPTWL